MDGRKEWRSVAQPLGNVVMNDSNTEPVVSVDKDSVAPEAPSSQPSETPKFSRLLFWFAIVLVCVIFGNGLFPRISMVLDWLGTFQLQIVTLVWGVIFFLSKK